MHMEIQNWIAPKSSPNSISRGMREWKEVSAEHPLQAKHEARHWHVISINTGQHAAWHGLFTLRFRKGKHPSSTEMSRTWHWDVYWGHNDSKDCLWSFSSCLRTSWVYVSNSQHNVIHRRHGLCFHLRNNLAAFYQVRASDEMISKENFRSDKVKILGNSRGFLYLNVASYQWFWGHASHAS